MGQAVRATGVGGDSRMTGSDISVSSGVRRLDSEAVLDQGDGGAACHRSKAGDHGLEKEPASADGGLTTELVALATCAADDVSKLWLRVRRIACDVGGLGVADSPLPRPVRPSATSEGSDGRRWMGARAPESVVSTTLRRGVGRGRVG